MKHTTKKLSITCDTENKTENLERGEFITLPYPTGRRSN